jgi:hypothetical protein
VCLQEIISVISESNQRSEELVSKINCFTFAVVLCLLLSIAQPANIFAQNVSTEKVIAENLKSIGEPTLLTGLKSRAFVGPATAEFIQGGTGGMVGTGMLVSSGQKLAIVFQFKDTNYPREYLAYDGKDVSVSTDFMNPGNKSPLGDFIFRFNSLMKSGLMGGTLSGNWPFLDPAKKAEMKLKETTVDGQQLYEIDYQPKPALRDVKIRMYFDPKTFHHVRTRYEVRIKEGDQSVRAQATDPTTGGRASDVTVTTRSSPSSSTSYQVAAPNANSDVMQVMPESIYVLVEKFGDFQEESGIVLPHSYTLDYSVEGQGSSFVAKWNMKFSQAAFNKALDDKIFKATK